MTITSISKRVRSLVEGLAEQQAIPDESWRHELGSIIAALQVCEATENEAGPASFCAWQARAENATRK